MDNSLWISCNKEKQKEYKRFEKNIESNIVIIGGGLTGLTTAYYLSKQGKKVILIEKDKICNHTSRKYNRKNNISAWIIL